METNDVVERWTAPAFLAALKEIGACDEALAWLGDEEAAESAGVEPGLARSLSEVYEQLHRADWWLWLAGRLVVLLRRAGNGDAADALSRRMVLAACACARTALKYVPTGEERPLKAIETTERWARGEPGVTLEQVRAAAAAAAYDAYAAYAAGGAAYAPAAHAAAAAYSAAYAADVAYEAAYAATDAARAAAHQKALADMAPLVREHLPLEVVAHALATLRTPAEASSP